LLLLATSFATYSPGRQASGKEDLPTPQAVKKRLNREAVEQEAVEQEAVEQKVVDQEY
jgi:hypothetical protein